jgi:hypothetical protein
MAADHLELVQALAHDKGNLSTSLKGLEEIACPTTGWRDQA